MGVRTWKTVRPVTVVGDVAFITLTKSKVAVIDAADVPIIQDWNWSADKSNGIWYARHGKVKLHHAIAGMRQDHRDGDGLNNRRSNLRPASAAQNCWNRKRPSTNTSGFKGVSFRKDRRTWLAAIRKGKLIKIGTFGCPTLAALAYDKKARELFGEFASPNFGGGRQGIAGKSTPSGVENPVP